MKLFKKDKQKVEWTEKTAPKARKIDVEITIKVITHKEDYFSSENKDLATITSTGMLPDGYWEQLKQKKKKQLSEITLEEYNEMNEYPEYGHALFLEKFLERNDEWIFTPSEIEWLTSHNFDVNQPNLIKENQI